MSGYQLDSIEGAENKKEKKKVITVLNNAR